jgi:GT2 family glycosyltransferase
MADLLPDYERATGAALAERQRRLPPERGRVLRNDTNLGFAAANNQGYAAQRAMLSSSSTPTWPAIRVAASRGG